jgi:hypothetical protein
VSVAYDVPTPAGRSIRRTPAAVLPFPCRDVVESAAAPVGADTLEPQVTAPERAAPAPAVPAFARDGRLLTSESQLLAREGQLLAPDSRVAAGTSKVGRQPQALLVRREGGRVVAAVGAAADPLTVPAFEPDAERRCAVAAVVEAPAVARPVRIAPGASGARVRLTVRGRRVVAVLCAVALAAAVWITVGAVHGALTAPLVPSSAPAVVTVHPGETLWSIAARLSPERDPRAVVAALRERNHLVSSEVQAGQHLVVPR